MTPPHPAEVAADRLTWLGHSTVLLELSGSACSRTRVAVASRASAAVRIGRVTVRAVAAVHDGQRAPTLGTFLPLGLRRRHAHRLPDPPFEFAAHVATLAPATRVAIHTPGTSLSPSKHGP